MSTDLSRRAFITKAAGVGAGLALGIRIGTAKALEAIHAADDWAPNAYVHIGADGAVTIVMPKAEMGQGVFTALPMIVAEELDADWNTVKIEQSPARAPYDTTTGGSGSVMDNWMPLRQAGAAARAMLGAAAAAEWNVARSECRTEAGVAVHVDGNRRATYGSLTMRAASMPVPDVVQLRLKSPDEFRIVGKPTIRRDASAKANGSAVYGIDVRVPGMLIASVARCPVYQGTIARVDDSKARAIRGVRKIVTLDPVRGSALPARVAVIADTTWAAMKGRKALTIEWDGGAEADFSSAALRTRANAALSTDGEVSEHVGDVDAARSNAHQVVEHVYEVPFLAHATMEPMNCTAHVTDTSAELWMPSQFGSRMQGTVARFLNLPLDAVTVHVTFLGGGFGRRAYDDFVIDAVQIAKAAGAPVKVIWSREEDVQHDLYRPASVQRLRAALDAQGRPTSWENRVAAPGQSAFWNPNTQHPGASDAPDTVLYEIPNRHADFVHVPAPVPLGAWRAVRHTQNIFAIESFVDELAHAAGADAIAYRTALLSKDARARYVLELVRDASGWGKPLAKGRGRGVAFMRYGGTYVAHVAEVSTNEAGSPHIERVTCAFDCGQMVNPDTVRAQIESAIIWGLSATMWGEITVENGRTRESNFHDYRVARIADTPPIDVRLVVNHETPTGVGEPAVPGVAPAITNALFAASGRRARRLPLAKG